jgi:hypothetical protein
MSEIQRSDSSLQELNFMWPRNVQLIKNLMTVE